MIGVTNLLASYGFFGGGAFGNMLATWESIGVFSYILPFLLIFATVFTVLNKAGIFQDKKGINIIVALSISLMSLQFDFVPIFFSEIFPRFGVGLGVLLVLFIFASFFFDMSNKGTNTALAIIGMIVAAIVIVRSLSEFGWIAGAGGFGGWLSFYWPQVLIAILIVAAIVTIAVTSSPKPQKKLNLNLTPEAFK